MISIKLLKISTIFNNTKIKLNKALQIKKALIKEKFFSKKIILIIPRYKKSQTPLILSIKYGIYVQNGKMTNQNGRMATF